MVCKVDKQLFLNCRNMKVNDPLCCCEYGNSTNERNRLLGCCSNCEDVDICCDRFFSCNRVSFEFIWKIIHTIHDFFRMPWRGGAKQIAFDSWLPILLQPIFIYLAALNMWFTMCSSFSMLLLLWYMNKFFVRKCPQTKFFFMWTVVFILLLVFVFEIYVVPLLEILPEENIAFVTVALLALFCLYKVLARSQMNKVKNGDIKEHLLGSRRKAMETVCSVCRKCVPPRTYHCSICQTCILLKHNHCLWLDCCIGDKNYCQFILALFFSFCALIYEAILTLTSVCHPVYIWEFILLPDDCSDVYHDFEIALCFVSALYSLFIAALLFGLLGQYCWYISMGVTKQEWDDLPLLERRCCGIRANRPYTVGFLGNWVNFLRGQSNLNNLY